MLAAARNRQGMLSTLAAIASLADRCSVAPGPQPVSRLSCEIRGASVQVIGGAPAEIDYVSIEVTSDSAPTYGDNQVPDVHYVAASVNGSFTAMVPLTVDRPTAHKVSVRAHSRGCGTHVEPEPARDLVCCAW
jgi:hypothetical protein